MVVFASFLFLLPSCCHTICEAFAFVGVGSVGFDSTSKTITTGTGLMMMMTTTTMMMIVTDNNNNPRRQQRRQQQQRIASLLNMAANVYDDFRSDAVVDTMYLDEENVMDCLNEFINSEYGTTMFGCHDRASSIGITGYIEFVELCGPTVTLRIPNDDDCKFWHKRSFVLGRAAVYLNARIPEITNVIVNDLEELNDFQEIKDEFGEILYKKDKRSNDFNGDRYTMEYQGYVRSLFIMGLPVLPAYNILCLS